MFTDVRHAAIITNGRAERKTHLIFFIAVNKDYNPDPLPNKASGNSRCILVPVILKRPYMDFMEWFRSREALAIPKSPLSGNGDAPEKRMFPI